MTDIEMLPMPEGVDVIFSPDGNGAALDVFTAEQVQDYARANMEPLIAEIEALRRELDRLRGEHVRVRRDRNAAQARAERLAEALRELVEYVQETAHHNAPAAAAARAALRDHDQEVGNG